MIIKLIIHKNIVTHININKIVYYHHRLLIDKVMMVVVININYHKNQINIEHIGNPLIKSI